MEARSDGERAAQPRVLHVIESFGAGSANAMQEFVTATPELRHHLLRAVRDGEFDEGDLSDRFETVAALPDGLVARVAEVRRQVAALKPDVIHAHSSLAGLYVRLAVRTTRRRRIVYSPHCFAFVRQDLPLPIRGAIAAVEFGLALNTAAIGACSRGERAMATRLPTRLRPVFVPNTPRAVAAAPSPHRTRTVVGVGRLGPQKDPATFARVLAAVRLRRPDMHATWVGDGDADHRAPLDAAAIDVTGWAPAERVARELETGGVYLHTAAWEGFPLALLEALAADLPVVARRIPAFRDMPDDWLFDDVTRGAEQVLDALDRPGDNLAAWRRALQDDTREAQRAALLELYAVPALR